MFLGDQVPFGFLVEPRVVSKLDSHSVNTARMLSTVDALLRRLPPTALLGICILSVGLLGAVDYATGYELSLRILYVAPLAAATWYVGRRSGLTMAALSAGTWFATDWSSGHRYSHTLFHVWNASIGFSFFVVIAYLVSALRDHLRLEHRLARLDPLTSAGNGRAFAETAHTVLELARRHGHTTVVGLIDLDNFKRVNDEIGHAGGDRVLKAVVETLQHTVRSSDLVARLGGDEFVLLLPQTSRAGAERVFAKVQRRLSELANTRRWPITHSVGVAVFRVPPASPDEALRVADHLMYQVKTMGKNAMLIEEISPADTAIAWDSAALCAGATACGEEDA
jgi:diguanylate cyclase (GGDEF)-like protein